MDISTWKRTPQNTPFLGHDKEGPGREEVQRKTLRKTFGAQARPGDRDQGGCAGDLPPGYSQTRKQLGITSRCKCDLLQAADGLAHMILNDFVRLEHGQLSAATDSFGSTSHLSSHRHGIMSDVVRTSLMRHTSETLYT